MPPEDNHLDTKPGQFDFIMNEPPKRAHNLPLPNLPKPARITLGVVLLLLILAIGYSVLFGNKVSSKDQMLSAAAQAQEVSRISLLAQRDADSREALDLAKTTESVMTSQQTELVRYLALVKVKVEPAQLLTKKDVKTDATLATAKQNNAYDDAYYSYLKAKLPAYQTTLRAIYPSSGPKLKTILSDDFDSVETLLSSPQLK